jgi:starch synthase (maltosyl-transferring)
MRPNFWPNTPDILAGPLRNGGPGAFRMRAVLAAMLVPSWGVYGGFELCENLPASETNEEYLYSEKYELKQRDWSRPDSLAPFLTRLNEIRRAHPALQRLRGLQFHLSHSDHILAFSRVSADGSDVVLVVVNLDPEQPHEDTLWLDLPSLGLSWTDSYEAHDELSGRTYTWEGAAPYVRLDPAETPAHILHLRGK